MWQREGAAWQPLCRLLLVLQLPYNELFVSLRCSGTSPTPSTFPAGAPEHGVWHTIQQLGDQCNHPCKLHTGHGQTPKN